MRPAMSSSSALTPRVLDLISQGRLADAADLVFAQNQERPNDAEVMRLGALVLWRGSDRQSAQAVLNGLLDQHPEDDEAMRILGALQMEEENALAASATYERLCHLPTAQPHDWIAWAEALIACGHYRAAAGILEKIRPLADTYPEVRLQLADVYIGEERVDEAMTLLEEARAANPDDLRVLATLSRLHASRGQYAQALALLKHFTEINPTQATGWLELARFHNWLHEYPQAMIALSKAATLAPDNPDIHYAIGDLCVRLKAYAQAEIHYRRVIDLAPERRDDAEAAIAVARFNQGDPLGAEATLQAMLARDTESFPARRGLIFIYEQTHRHAEALAILDELLARSGGNPLLRFNRGLALLRLGRLREGWQEWEQRFRTGLRIIESDQPTWQGQAIPDQRLLVIWEQGFGDSIQFVRFLPLLKPLAGRVLLLCQVGLKSLFERSVLADEVYEAPLRCGELPAHDYAVPLMSLPHRLDITLENLPAATPYLKPDGDRIAHWKQRMSGEGGLRVGLVWSGSPTHSNDPNRTCPTEKLKWLADIPGVRYYSLLKGPDVRQLAQLSEILPICELGSQFANFDDTAAALMNIDLLISVDTSVAHLGGALGRPVWLLLPVNPDWRWLIERADSPWYPTFRLFRQKRYQDWDEVLQRVAAELRLLATTTPAH